jgi:hypothetical protein
MRFDHVKHTYLVILLLCLPAWDFWSRGSENRALIIKLDYEETIAFDEPTTENRALIIHNKNV